MKTKLLFYLWLVFLITITLFMDIENKVIPIVFIGISYLVYGVIKKWNKNILLITCMIFGVLIFTFNKSKEKPYINYFSLRAMELYYPNLYNLGNYNMENLEKYQYRDIANIFYIKYLQWPISSPTIKLKYSIGYYYQLCLFFNNNECSNYSRGKDSVAESFKNRELDNKREARHYNLSKKWYLRTINIPQKKLDFILYGYPLFMNDNLISINNDFNECLYLLYGAQNGWESYRTRLVYKLENDVKMACFNNIGNYNYFFDDSNFHIDKKYTNKNEMRSDLILFLKHIKYE